MRDTLLGEDTSSVQGGAIPQVKAALRNTALSVSDSKELHGFVDMMEYYS